MPKVTHRNRIGYQPFGAGEQNAPEGPGFGETLSAATMYNPMVAAHDYLTGKEFAEDPQFDIAEAARDNPRVHRYQASYVKARSRAEFDYIDGRIKDQEKKKQTLSAAGIGGIAAAIGMGVVSPTVFIPLAGPAKGAKGIRDAFLLAGAAATIDEAPLLASMETYSKTDAAIGIAAGTVLGGLLGSAAVYVRDKRALREAAGKDMAGYNSERAILYPSGQIERISLPTNQAAETLRTRLRENLQDDLEGLSAEDITPETLSMITEDGYMRDAYAALGINTVEDLRRFVENPDTFNPTADQLIAHLEAGRVDTDVSPLAQHVREVPEGPDSAFASVARRLEEASQEYGFARTISESEAPENIFQQRVWREEVEAFMEAADEAEPRLMIAREELGRILSELPEVNELAVQRMLASVTEQDLENFARSMLQGAEPIGPLRKLVQDVAERNADTVWGPKDRLSVIEQHQARNAEIEEQIRLLREGETSPALQTRGEGGSLSAASPQRPFQGFLRPPKYTTKLFEKLVRLSPLGRVVEQSISPSAQRLAMQMGDAGLKGARNAEGIAHAPGGTLEARVYSYDAHLADFLQTLDDAFSRHILGDRVPEGQLQSDALARIKAAVHRQPGKMSNEEFNREAWRVAQTGEEHPDANVMKAAKAWNAFAGEIKELADEAFEARRELDPNARPLIPEDANLGPDAINYLTHVYDLEAISKDPLGFLDDLRGHAEQNLSADFAKDWERFTKKRKKMREHLDDLRLDGEQSRAAYATVQEAINEIETSPRYSAWRDEQKRLQKEIKATENPALKEQLQEELTEAKKVPDDMLEDVEFLKYLKGRQASLAKSVGKMEEKQEEILKKIEALEVQDLNALERVTNAGMKLAKKLDRLSDNRLDAEAMKLWKQFEAALKRVENLEKRMAKVYGNKALNKQQAFDAYNRVMAMSKKREEVDAKVDQLIARIENAENFDRQQARDTLYAIQSLNNVRVRDLNARRAVREEKLAQQYEDFDPAKVKERADELEESLRALEDDFDTKWRERGAVDLDIDEGRADFSFKAKEDAEEISDRIRGLDNPVAGLEILGAERGPELARTLNLPLEVKQKWLVTDLEKVARIYNRKIAPDIELYRATGSVNAAPVFREIKEETRRLIERVGSSTVRPKSNRIFRKWALGERVDLENVETIPFTQEAKADIIGDISAMQRQLTTDMEVLVRRLRHQRGVPKDPEGVGYRLGRAAMDANVFRLMGTVMISSVPDVGRPVMKMGLRTTFRNGWMPFLTNMQRVKLSRAEAKRLGIALDPVLHNRAQAVFDMWEDYASRKTKGERVMGFLSNKTGLIAGFDRWTAEMKQITASVAFSEISHALQITVGGAQASAKEVQKARTFLAANGLGTDEARRVWNQYMLEGGSTDVDGIKLPNTEAWEDRAAKRMIAGTMNKIVNDTIVTPGLDRPSWMDENTAFKMVAQFRSFTFTSNNRVLLAGMQAPDMALMNGIGISLALGALSYYTWAVSVGGDALDEAMQFNADSWADEAIDRSGLLGVFAEGRRIAERIPATQDLVTFADQRTSRRAGVGLIGAVAGPSFDLGQKLSNVVLGIDDPTQSTVHQARLMMAYQNVFYLRQLFDAAEERFAANFPERRE